MYKAKFSGNHIRNAKSLSPGKETTQTYVVCAVSGGEFFQPVRVVVCQSRSQEATRVHAAIWVYGKHGGFNASGRGFADGYGYDKTSAAIEKAIKSAGITISQKEKGGERYDGAGDYQTRQAIAAIARAAGFRKFTIID